MMKGFFKSQTSALLNLSDRLKVALSDFTGVGVVAIASLVASGFVLGVRHLGGLQPLELVALDQLVRLHSDPGPDPRLLVVGITEGDIRTQKQWPLSDRTIAQLLAKLQFFNDFSKPRREYQQGHISNLPHHRQDQTVSQAEPAIVDA